MFELNIALNALWALLILLALLFLFLLIYTFWTREKKKYWERYEQKFRNYFFPRILNYAEKTSEEKSADDIIKKISKRTKDYTFFLRLLDELNNLLRGTESERLSHLIEHPLFLEFYQKKLFQLSKKSKIFACMYFQHSGNIQEEVQTELAKLSRSKDLKLAYAATKALQATENLEIRQHALLDFFKRKDISELMIIELLHLFDPNSEEERRAAGKKLQRLLLKDIQLTAKDIIVRYLGHKNFYGTSEFLLNFLEKIQYKQKKAPLVRALIIALGKLYNYDALPVVRTYLSNKQINEKVQLACVETLSFLGGEESCKYLTEQLPDAKFSVRKSIIQQLAYGDEKKVALLHQFIIANQHFISKFHNQDNLPKHLKCYILKIKNIALGIKIALSHRLMNTYG